MEASPERARVSAWKLRAAVYGFVLAVAAAVLIPRLSQGGTEEVEVLKGTTGQGSPIEVSVAGDRVTFFDLDSIAATCPDGRRFDSRWYPSTSQSNVSYTRRGRRFEIHEWPHPDFPQPPGRRVNLYMRGTLGPHDRSIGGDVRVTVQGPAETCRSGPVPFSARR